MNNHGRMLCVVAINTDIHSFFFFRVKMQSVFRILIVQLLEARARNKLDKRLFVSNVALNEI